jgi:dephospho-CoA kinase
MTTAGLTGGFACGKSFVGRKLAELGCHVVRADDLGHQVLSPGGEAYAEVVREFGSGILREDGSIDRKLLAAKVFNDPERLAVLNNLVHPAVFRLEEQFMEEVRRTDPHGIAVVEAAILIETGSYKRYDRLIVVVCEEEQQLERAMHRDGVTREEALARVRRQMPLGEKRQYADFVIDTSGSKESTADQVRAVYEALRGAAK